ncbi:MAG: tripartite tricarboxylate transporter substrate-binding protein, partial [Proteobacteria bacterium]|nr:tripartite tricarboxylate transporter substrate-binding protein [Pseudomonadota bacterium]
MKLVFSVAAVLAIAVLPQAAFAQAYPAKPVRILAPFPAGAGVDIVARMIGQPLAEQWGQAIVVDNRPGAGGTIACELVAKAVPDGHTLLLASVGMLAINPGLYAKLQYAPLRDFRPVTMLAAAPYVLVV